VFAFTAIGHFIKTSEMTQMLPSSLPMRAPLSYVSGVFELLSAIAILIPSLSRHVGIALCIFLLLILLSNVYAAIQRVDFWRARSRADLSVTNLGRRFFSASASISNRDTAPTRHYRQAFVGWDFILPG
jgi:uncharacterized membrane protein